MLKILCLHGDQQTSGIFENQLSRLQAALADTAVLEYVEAPFLLPFRTDEDAVQTRSWLPTGEVADYTEGDRVVDEAVAGGHHEVLLGFSHGAIMAVRYVMRHKDTQGRLRGIIVVGLPDPRHLFPPNDPVWAGARGGISPTGGLLGELPSLHIVGRVDAIVSPEDSVAFAASCGASAELLVHEHAHSVPQQQSAFATIRAFCEAVAQGSAAIQELWEARSAELELLSNMFDDCVRGADHPGGAVVSLPLLSDVEEASGDDEAVTAALKRLALVFRVPCRYPAVLPDVALTGGPGWHSVAFERWRAELLLRTVAHMRDDVGLGGAMVMPAWMCANAQALEEMERLRQSLMRLEEAGPSEDMEAAPRASEWELEGEEEREANIAEAEREAERLLTLKRRAPSAHDTRKGGDEAGAGAESAEADESVSRKQGGSWTLTIGLIGKPSAGKSTFFNVITDPQSESEAARVAAFPFTTIDPNVGTGFGPLRCPCAALVSPSEKGSQPLRAGFDTCDAAYGHVTALGTPLYRRHPIVVKDVAGLVQGAYQGRGKGNQFLNDLCDADVLVHVVDGAGATNADGTACPAGQGSTLEDIAWVRAEVHNWIYDNLRSKWQSIFRTPLKLRTMFSGYRSGPGFIDAVLLHMSIHSPFELSVRLRTWGPRELHLLVALYTRMRFPMVVALNKADLSTAAGLEATLRERYPTELFSAMTAQVEWDLLVLRKKGHVRYLSGESAFEVLHSSGLDPADAKRLQRAQSFFSTRGASQAPDAPTLRSTGVQNVVAMALSQCATVSVFPVSAFTPAVPSLQHCFVFKRGTTADQVFWALTYAKLLDGSFVRFEATDAWKPQDGVAILKKTDTIPAKAVLARVLSNKRQKS